MEAILALVRMNLKLSLREKGVLFFNYIFPLIFFYAFGQMFGAVRSGMGTRVFIMVIVLGVLGNGLWGSGMRAVIERETGVLRRYKVAPITPLPLLVASILSGWLLYMPSFLLLMILSHFYYRMPIPDNLLSLIVMVSIGSMSFRAVGLIVASVVNSVAESNILIQLLYTPMLFLSGATFPLSVLPGWAQIVAQFMPATHLLAALESIVVRQRTVFSNLVPAGTLLLTALLSTFISVKLFRWEKGEKIPVKSKMWIVAVMLPFLLLGGWQYQSRENVLQARIVDRNLRRLQTRLIRGARIFIGDGKVIESGSVLLRDGRIQQVFEGGSPDADQLDADLVDGKGRTLIPGFVDTSLNLLATGGPGPNPEDLRDPRKLVLRNLAQQLYCGVTAVRQSGAANPIVEQARSQISSGAFLGAEVVQAADPASGEDLPSLASYEAGIALGGGNLSVLGRSLVQQVAPRNVVEGFRAAGGSFLLPPAAIEELRARRTDREALLLKQAARESNLTIGTDSGRPLLVHGPVFHLELQLWVRAGVPTAKALAAATAGGAVALGIADRTGYVKKGYEATLVLLDGNPLEDIQATERIAAVFYKGEGVQRGAVLTQK